MAETANNIIVANNVVRALATSAGDAFIVTSGVAPLLSTDVTISGNHCDADLGAQIQHGVFLDVGSQRVRVLNNTLRGFVTRGVWGFAAYDAEVTGNLIDGVTTPTGSRGVYFDNDTAGRGMRISGNSIFRVATGIARFGAAPGNIYTDNIIREVTTGIDGFENTYSYVSGNVIDSTGTALENLTNGVNNNVVVNNITLP
jgi:hypothetical protein